MKKTQILNTWKSDKIRTEFYEVGEPVYQNGDFYIYPHHVGYLYAYKKIAINHLVGLNKQHIDNLAKNERPNGKHSASSFLFDIAQETKKRGLQLIRQ